MDDHFATRSYRDALDFKPNEPEIWVQCGHALKESRKVSEAEVAYRKALKLAPRTPIAIGARSSTNATGKWEKVAAADSKAFALDSWSLFESGNNIGVFGRENLD
jgi:hypothetical protein